MQSRKKPKNPLMQQARLQVIASDNRVAPLWQHARICGAWLHVGPALFGLCVRVKLQKARSAWYFVQEGSG